jgi:membrane fusion protein, macrolide-specific efflux system
MKFLSNKAVFAYKSVLAPQPQKLQKHKVEQGEFKLQFSSTGMITPKNKIILTSPVAGRVDKILVEEGDLVKKGQMLAQVSSSDRAALLEAGVSKELLDMYKPTPIRSTISGRIISKKLVLGQTVNTESTLFEISDELRIVSKVDEADIGRVAVDQKVDIKIDAFPDQLVKAHVERIGQQSTMTNNVTTFEVFLAPAENLDLKYRAGMTVTALFEVVRKEQVVLIPAWLTEGRKNTVLDLQVIENQKNEAISKSIKVGDSNGENIEVLSGLSVGDTILYVPVQYSKENKGLPFGMGGGRKNK